jgi:membrane protease YdiL (CAAX protease family)
MPTKEVAIKHSTLLATYLLIVWGFYRFIFKFPENVEDLIIKPIVWLIPVVILIRKEKLGPKSVGLTFKNFFPSIYSSLILGIIFAFVGMAVNFAKYQSFNFTSNIGESPFFTALLLSLATGFTEEVTFRGFIFNRVWHALENEWLANIIVSLVWGLVHIPIAIFWWKLNLSGTIGTLVLITIFGVGSSYVFARTKNVTSSILLHMLWEWPIILFR